MAERAIREEERRAIMALLSLILGVVLLLLAARRVSVDSGPMRVVVYTFGSAALMVIAAWFGLR